jgi:hypothetical protein
MTWWRSHDRYAGLDNLRYFAELYGLPARQP